MAASAAKAPAMTKTRMRVRATGTPEKRAACRLPPMAKTDLPKAVRWITNARMAAQISRIAEAIGKSLPNSPPDPSCTSDAGKLMMAFPCKMRKAIPVYVLIDPSVTANEGSSNMTTTNPLTSPRIPPRMMANPAATQIFIPCCQRTAITTPQRASVEAIERSISPVIITGATPSARKPRTVALRAIVSRLNGVRKLLDAAELPAITITISRHSPTSQRVIQCRATLIQELAASPREEERRGSVPGGRRATVLTAEPPFLRSEAYRYLTGSCYE